MSGIRAISSAYIISKHIPTAQDKEVPLKFEFLSSFFNSLMNIIKSLGLIGQPCLTPSLQRKVCDALVYSHNGLNLFIYTFDNFRKFAV